MAQKPSDGHTKLATTTVDGNCAGIECGHPVESGTVRTTIDFDAGTSLSTGRCIRCRKRVECAWASATADLATGQVLSTTLERRGRKPGKTTVFAPLNEQEAEGLAIAAEIADPHAYDGDQAEWDE